MSGKYWNFSLFPCPGYSFSDAWLVRVPVVAEAAGRQGACSSARLGLLVVGISCISFFFNVHWNVHLISVFSWRASEGRVTRLSCCLHRCRIQSFCLVNPSQVQISPKFIYLILVHKRCTLGRVLFCCPAFHWMVLEPSYTLPKSACYA